MTEEEILNGNEAIVEFMGAEKTIGGSFKKVPIPTNKIIISDTCQRHLYELEYHKSWDWLMPVIEKIRNMQGDNKEIHLRYSILTDLMTTCNINTVYKNGVIEFIKWYNENKKEWTKNTES